MLEPMQRKSKIGKPKSVDGTKILEDGVNVSVFSVLAIDGISKENKADALSRNQLPHSEHLGVPTQLR